MSIQLSVHPSFFFPAYSSGLLLNWSTFNQRAHIEKVNHSHHHRVRSDPSSGECTTTSWLTWIVSNFPQKVQSQKRHAEAKSNHANELIMRTMQSVMSEKGDIGSSPCQDFPQSDFQFASRVFKTNSNPCWHCLIYFNSLLCKICTDKLFEEQCSKRSSLPLLV